MSSDLTFIPHIVINPTNIVSYLEVVHEGPVSRRGRLFVDTDHDSEETDNFLHSKRKAEGIVSEQAKRKISKAIEYLITIANEKKVLERVTRKYVVFRTAFLTLTLPSKQIHSDKEIINTCLNSFFNELRKYHQVKNYIWRAELQHNGNIHFHIVTDSFVPWTEARDRWNRIVNKLGYVDRFHEKHGHRVPNSTDIHSTRKIRNLKAYLVKYMTKKETITENQHDNTENVRVQEGRLWGCNHELSQARGLNLIIDSEIDTELKKITNHSKIYKYEATYFTVYYIDYHKLKEYGSELLFKYFSDYLFEHFKFTEQLKFTA